MPECIQTLRRDRIVPVVVLERPDRAAGLARALLGGGLNSAEITMRTPAALQAIEQMTISSPEILVGAGTVLTVNMARDAVAAGAKFIVSPGLSREVASWCLEHEIPVFPGVTTPSEITAALDMGLREMKFFPAEQSGGVSMLKALSAPFRSVQFMPTGGISLSNINSYLALPNVLACGGSWLCPSKLIDAGEFDRIRQLCDTAVHAVSLDVSV